MAYNNRIVIYFDRHKNIISCWPDCSGVNEIVNWEFRAIWGVRHCPVEGEDAGVREWGEKVGIGYPRSSQWGQG